MVGLMWWGNDGFDPKGRRVAYVAWCWDPFPARAPVLVVGHSGPTFFAPGSYWEAFISYDGRFDRVLVDGAEGRWSTADEAKAAAETAFEVWETGSSSTSESVVGEDVAQARGTEAVDLQDRKLSDRVLAHLVGLHARMRR